MIREPDRLLNCLRELHAAIRDELCAACTRSTSEELAEVSADQAGDTIFAIDRISERVLLERFEPIARQWPCILVAEGLPDPAGVALPAGSDPERAELRIIIDPIDGTRGLIYQKRSAWILTGVAPNRGPRTGLADIELALQTEIPLVKQHLCDTLWACAGQGTCAERFDRVTGAVGALRCTPSQAASIKQGYGGLARFFPPDITELAAVEDAVVEHVLGPKPPGKALVYNDQYVSTAGQLYELLMGHDRWIADLRPLLNRSPRLAARRLQGLCCHPYDLCTELIAREGGVIVTDENGIRPSAPLNTEVDISWIGYANEQIRAELEPVLQAVLHQRRLM
jgi:hypothetical protein